MYKYNETVNLKEGDIIKLGPNNLNFVFNNATATSQEAGNVSEPSVIILEDSITSPSSNKNELVYEKAKELEQETPDLNVGLVKTEISEATTSKQDEKDEIMLNNTKFNIMEDELTCSICSELFIKAMTLTCSHTFCKFCIEEWKKNKSTCPICRKEFSIVSPTLVLDNFIAKIMNTRSSDLKETRKLLIKQREEISDNNPSSSTHLFPTVQISENSVIEIPSEDDDDDTTHSSNPWYSDDSYDDFDDDYMRDDDEDEDVPYNGLPGTYYGGYGRCYLCKQRGHWANGCPSRRR